MRSRSIIGDRIVLEGLNCGDFKRPESILTLVYGVNVLKMSSKLVLNPRRIFLKEFNKKVLQITTKSKKNSASKVTLSTIRNVELNGKSPAFSKFKQPFDKSCAISLFFKNRTLDLVFPSQLQMNLWISGVIYILDEKSEAISKKSSANEEIVSNIWGISDVNNSGNLSYTEIKQMIKNLNFYINHEELQKLFRKFDENENGVIEKAEFNALIESLMTRKEIELIFLRYSGGLESIPKDTLKVVLSDLNGNAQDYKKIKKIYIEFVRGQKVFSLKSFQHYIMNADLNSMMKPEAEEISMDMSQPLTHYFIASSHNTYLEGNQLTGHSCAEQYSKVLINGCRCIEIDIWEGEHEPIVTHGHTLVNKIPLREVLDVIKKSAFVTTPYPVVFSIENHCGYTQTGIMGELFSSILSEQIFVPMNFLPSPEDLKFKFLIKCKKKISKSDPKKSTHPKFGSLIGIVSAEFSLEQTFNSIVSFKEKKFGKIVKKHSSEKIIHYHSKSLTRIYPSGKRIDSSNYNPINFWIHGAQFAAINYQNSDLGSLINHALFICNGRSGYILKPSFMRDPSVLIDINGESLKKPVMNLRLNILSGFNLPKVDERDEIVSPYVEVSIFGIPADLDSKVTHTIEKNGFNPIWDHEMIFGIRLMEMCIIVIKIFTKDIIGNKIIAQNALPLFALRKGLRVLKLLGPRLERLENSFLICKTSLDCIDD